MLHRLAVYRQYVPPQYYKHVSKELCISSSVLKELEETTECLISFHNTLKNEITINQQTQNDTSQVDATTEQMLNGSAKEPLNLLLGYIQLAGYVTLNYQFDADAASNPMDAFSKHSSWWHNKDYSHHYLDNDKGPDEDLDPHEQIAKVPFVRQPKLVIGGRIAGINDLPLDGSKTINRSNRHLLQDLICTFNSFPTPDGTQDDENFIPGSELVDAIVPFYTTSQSILFTNLVMKPSETKTFHIAFPSPKGPPSYNSMLTGPACDQGWVSIRDTMIVGFQTGPSHEQEKAVYFPLHIKVPRKPGDERWYQPNFLKQTEVNKDWAIELINEDVSKTRGKTPEPSGETKEAFLEDLHRLIDSDLYNMPRMSTGERKKSFHDPSNGDKNIIPQIPVHHKTSYQIRVNAQALCTVHFSKPYYQVGDSLGFILELEPVSTTRIAGFVAHLEAHEVFHTGEKDVTNVYRVSPPVKGNTLAAAFQNGSSEVSGQIYIPTHLCQQFQSSNFMDLKYFVVFKFNIFELDVEVKDSEGYDVYKYGAEGNETTFRLPIVVVAGI